MKKKKTSRALHKKTESAEKIVGIGASAGGLEAFTELLRNLPLDLNVAYILVQHLDPSHRSLLSELLARTTRLQVREITNNTRVEGKQIYVIPPNSDLAIVEGVLKLSPRGKIAGPARSIDNFLTSLATDQKDNAIAVILSGAGSDGAQGLRAVKAAGGITFAQDDRSAKYDSMPRAALGTGCVDFVLPPEKIAEELTRLVCSPGTIKSRAAANAKRRRGQVSPKISFGKRSSAPMEWPMAPGDSNLRNIFHLLRTKTGLDFTYYKSNTIRRRLARRLSMHKIKGLEDYLRFLRQYPAELDELHQDLLINVTSFFRNPVVFEQLKSKIFPKLMRNLAGSEGVRIWVAGCSTGQEAYSIAIAYSEFAEHANVRVPLQIFASDVNGGLLEFARTGRYTRAETDMVNRARLERFFIKEDGHYRVIKAIRDLVIFAEHNLLQDPPFTRVDLISCRNMLIYFDQALQQKIFPGFHYALKPNGYMMLGSSESIGQFGNLFGAVEQKHRIFIKKPAANGPRFDRPPVLPPGRKAHLSAMTKSGETNPFDAQKEADRLILQKYSPAGVLVNADGDILQFRGDAGQYLKLPTGKASFHLSKIARDGLVLPLERAFEKARREKKTARERNVSLDSGTRLVDIEVVPLKLKSTSYLILFEPAPQPPKSPPARAAGKRRASVVEARRLADLKQELTAAREHIHSLQEEHDTSVEELQASNEEVQSANEELQSLNEELETSNEELESANEELTTLNEELATRNTELREGEARLREQATLLEMAPLLARSPKDRIIFWSRGAQEMYGFTAEEAVGQTAHILLDTKAPEPFPRILARLNAQGHWQGEVTHRCKNGAVLAVATQWVVQYDPQKKVRAILEVNTNITARKAAEVALAESEEFNRTILESSPDCVKVLDLEGRVIFVNPAGKKLLETGDSETKARSYWPGLWEGEERELAEKAYRAALAGNSSRFVGFRRTPKGTPKWWDVVLRPIVGTKERPEKLLAVLRDITAHKKQELAYAERARLTALRAEITSQIASDAPFQPVLQRIAQSFLNELDLGAVRIWVFDHDALALEASAEKLAQMHGENPHGAIPSARTRKIAEGRRMFLTNDLKGDLGDDVESPIPDDGVVSFVGYPLLIAEKSAGVMEVYGKEPFSEPVLAELSFAANGISQFIQRKQTDEKLRVVQIELSRYNSGLEKLVAERTASLQRLVEQMEEFSYSISHDLRAPARAMEGYAAALLEDYGDRLDVTGRDYLDHIVRNSSRMDRMIQEILMYSRVSRCEVTLRPVVLAPLIHDILEQHAEIQPFASGIKVNLGEETVLGHEPSLMQAISNLLSNACKFVAPDKAPQCRIWAESENGHVRLCVRDNGIGIKPEYQHRLFGVFERIHPGSQYEGNGIGLAIVRKAVERMSGKVGVESDGVNGSLFWIQLCTPEKRQDQPQTQFTGSNGSHRQ